MLDNIIHFVKKNGVHKKYTLMIVFMAMCILYQYNIFDNVEITDFNRIQGMATAKNIDIGKLIMRFHVWFFMIVLLFISGFILFAIFSEKTKNQKGLDKVIDKLNVITVISCICLFINYYIKLNQPSTSLSTFIVISFWSILLILIYHILVGNRDNTLKWNDFKWIMMISVVLCVIINVFTFKYVAMFYPFVFSLFLLISDYLARKNLLLRLKAATIPIYYTLFIMCVYSELSVILNQNHIDIGDARIGYFIIWIITVLFCYYRFKSSKLDINKEWENQSYMGMVISFSLLLGMPKISTEINIDLFEQANTALPISQLFSFGKIPMIETHSAHMLSDFVFGIVYKVCNRDLFGSYFGMYNGLENTISIVILYFMLKEFLHRDLVLLYIMFFPFYYGSSMLWGSVCFISILALVYLLKKKTSISYYLFWIALAFSVLYKGDIGLAIGIGCIITLFPVMIFWKDMIDIKRLCKSFVYVTVFLIAIYFIVCMAKGINPLDRALEFLAIMLRSNQNWAYGEIGNTSTLAFSFVYGAIPLITILLLFHLLWLCYRNDRSSYHEKQMIVILIVLALSYFINYSRSVVRHSLIECPVMNLLFTFSLLFPMYLYYIKQKRSNYFIISLFVLTILCGSLTSLEYSNLLSPFDVAVNRISDSNTFAQSLGNEKIIRTRVTEEFQNSYKSITDEINLLLSEDETFLDFSNQTLLYALTHRENPVYISQSPGLLIDDFTQDKFIEEIEQCDKKVPLVVMADNEIKFGLQVDGILNTYRYYRVAEFIYNNYEPVEKVGDYAIWCERNRTDIKTKIRNKNKSIEIDDLDDKILSYVNADVKNTKGSLTFDNQTDPYILGLEKIIPESHVDYLDVMISYSSDMEGFLQFYYTTEENVDYCEQNSVSADVVEGNGKVNLRLPYWEGIQYRLDMPDDSLFIIDKLAFGNTNIDDNYYNEVAHSYSLGDIPYLWANYDNKYAVQNNVQTNINLSEENTFDIDITELNRKQGNYLSVTLEAIQDENINLELGKKDGISYVKLTNYNFNIKAGTHTYLLRVSSDYYWTSNHYDYIRIYIDGNCIQDLRILEGD